MRAWLRSLREDAGLALKDMGKKLGKSESSEICKRGWIWCLPLV